MRGNARGRRPAHSAPRISVSRRHPALRAIGVVAALLALGALVAGGYDLIRSITSRGDRGSTGEQVDLSLDDSSLTYTNPYEWGRLSVGTNGRYHYIVDGTEVSRTGIDVSEHQGDIDWDSVASDGISFAIIRIGYRGTDNGVIGVDANYETNYREAREAGLDVGVYFYSQAVSVSEAQAEADFVLKELDGAELNYPVAFDMEPTTAESVRIKGLSDDQMNAIAHAFCERIEEGGYRTMIYGNKPDLSHLALEEFSSRGFWYACYDTRPIMDLAFGIWQYSSRGTVNGISTFVDMDIDLTSVLNSYQEEIAQSSDGSEEG